MSTPPDSVKATLLVWGGVVGIYSRAAGSNAPLQKRIPSSLELLGMYRKLKIGTHTSDAIVFYRYSMHWNSVCKSEIPQMI